jgi:hypothetical protein
VLFDLKQQLLYPSFMSRIFTWCACGLFPLCLLAQEPSSSSTSPQIDLNDLPQLQQSPDQNLNSSGLDFLEKPSGLDSNSPIPAQRTTVPNKEKTEALAKEKNWAVEGLKERRANEQAQLEEAELASLNELFENERKSIDDRYKTKSTNSDLLKPSISSNWAGSSASLDALNQTASEDLVKAKELEVLSKANQEWVNGLLTAPNMSKGQNGNDFGFSKTSSDSAISGSNRNADTSLSSTRNDSALESSSRDYLIQTGQTPNFQKLSHDPNFQITQNPLNPNSPASLATLNPVNTVPSIPRAVTSTMSLETMRQIEQQRSNAIRQPDPREINARIADPGLRR